jgi:hypothetical protein
MAAVVNKLDCEKKTKEYKQQIPWNLLTLNKSYEFENIRYKDGKKIRTTFTATFQGYVSNPPNPSPSTKNILYNMTLINVEKGFPDAHRQIWHALNVEEFIPNEFNIRQQEILIKIDPKKKCLSWSELKENVEYRVDKQLLKSDETADGKYVPRIASAEIMLMRKEEKDDCQFLYFGGTIRSSFPFRKYSFTEVPVKQWESPPMKFENISIYSIDRNDTSLRF